MHIETEDSLADTMLVWPQFKLDKSSKLNVGPCGSLGGGCRLRDYVGVTVPDIK